MVKINSLYELIKQKRQEKGRKIKVVCDWDEVLQPCGPKALYDVIKEKEWYEGKFPDFKEWFQEFWDEIIVDKNSDKEAIKKEIYVDYSRATKFYTKNKQLEEIRKDPVSFEEEFWKPFRKILIDSEFYNKAPLLSAAESLTRALDEGLISELAIVSSTKGIDNRKRKVFNNVFASSHPLLCNLSLFSFTRTGARRADWIKDNHSDFDIFVDDNLKLITETKEIFGPEKLYVSPQQRYISVVYPELWDSKNFYCYPDHATDISRTEPRKIQPVQNVERERARLRWMIGGVIICFAFGVLTVCLVFIIIKKKDKKIYK